MNPGHTAEQESPAHPDKSHGGGLSAEGAQLLVVNRSSFGVEIKQCFWMMSDVEIERAIQEENDWRNKSCLVKFAEIARCDPSPELEKFVASRRPPLLLRRRSEMDIP